MKVMHEVTLRAGINDGHVTVLVYGDENWSRDTLLAAARKKLEDDARYAKWFDHHIRNPRPSIY